MKHLRYPQFVIYIYICISHDSLSPSAVRSSTLSTVGETIAEPSFGEGADGSTPPLDQNVNMVKSN